MKLAVCTVVVSAARAAAADCTNAEFDQCGGAGFAGSDCCPNYDDCVAINEYYSQCQPKDLCLTPQYGQCGGTDHDGNPWDPKKRCCPDSFECTYSSQYFSQCLPVASNASDCAGAWKQCGGKAQDGSNWGHTADEKTCCMAGYECIAKDPIWYSQCEPIKLCSNARYGQCGGVDKNSQPWGDNNDACCPDGFECVVQDEWYSQCNPAPVETMLSASAAACTNVEFDQCGGDGFEGSECCPDYDECVVINGYFSQCQPKDLCLTPQWGQCGGTDHDGNPWDPKKSCCPDSFECDYKNEYFAQCLPVASNASDCAGAWTQCGGKDQDNNDWGHTADEKTCCISGYECIAKDPIYYSQCEPIKLCSNARYGQCGGVDEFDQPWEVYNSNCCPGGYECVIKDEWYSQCNPAATLMV